ncbi:hypothetical protein OH492_11250 [Vibrio chagasii]|nr:hypothetical protein [Vibrio chagasii]
MLSLNKLMLCVAISSGLLRCRICLNCIFVNVKLCSPIDFTAETLAQLLATLDLSSRLIASLLQPAPVDAEATLILIRESELTVSRSWSTDWFTSLLSERFRCRRTLLLLLASYHLRLRA